MLMDGEMVLRHAAGLMLAAVFVVGAIFASIDSARSLKRRAITVFCFLFAFLIVQLVAVSFTLNFLFGN